MGIVLKILSTIWVIFKIILIPLFAIIALISVLLVIYFLIALIKGKRLKKGSHVKTKRPGFLVNLFVNFPRRYIQDVFDKDPEFFTHQGCIVFTGRQGYGKTVAMVEQCMRWQKEYPKAKCISNLAYTHEDAVLDHWYRLVDYKNGIRGVIAMIDEMQNWFSSNQSKNFPPEMLEVVTQNRKNRRVIMGTAQCFNRLAKPLREQVTEVRKCITFCGCVTFVHRVIPELNAAGDVAKWKHRSFYYFVHTDEIRNSYDTYKVIEALKESGFQDPKPEVTVKMIQQ